MKTYKVGMIGVGWMAAGISEHSGIDCSPNSAESSPTDPGWLSWLEDQKEAWRQPISTITPVFIADAFVAHPRTKLVAGADTNPRTLEAFGSRYGVTSLYSDYRQMLEKESLDIVTVTTHTLPRAEITIDAAQAPGLKGLYLEQPMATTLEEADQMVDVCANKHVPLTFHSYHPSFRTARGLIERNEIGRLKSVTTPMWRAKGHTNPHYYIIGSEADWVFGVMQPHGHLDETCCNYQLTLFSGPLKPDHRHRCSQCGGVYCKNHVPPEAHRCPKSKEGLRSWLDDCDCELNLNRGLVHFKNGVDCYVGTGGHGSSFCGDGGTITMDPRGEFQLWRKASGPSWANNRLVELPWPPPQISEANAIYGIDDLVQCIEDGSEPKVSGRRVRDAMEIEIALRESHRAGNVKVELPLKDRKLRLTYRLRR